MQTNVLCKFKFQKSREGVCIFIYANLCICTVIFVFIGMYMHLYFHICMYIFIYYLFISIFLCTRKGMYTRICEGIGSSGFQQLEYHIFIHIWIFVHVNICTYLHQYRGWMFV